MCADLLLYPEGATLCSSPAAATVREAHELREPDLRDKRMVAEVVLYKILSREHISPDPMEPEFVDLFLAEGQRDSLCRVGEGREMPHHWALGVCGGTEDRLS